jgi:hypothetical protein
MYVIWANYVNRINSGNVANTLHANWPVLFNMTGQGTVRAMYALKERVEDATTDLALMPLTHGNPILQYPREPLFVCEAPPQKPPERPIVTMTRRAAVMAASAPTKGPAAWLPHERNPFATAAQQAVGVSDVEIMQDAMGWSGDDNDPIMAQTDSLLRLQRLSFAGPDTPPPSLPSTTGDEDGGRDPFESDTDAANDPAAAELASRNEEIVAGGDIVV